MMMPEAAIDELQRNLATVEQTVTNQSWSTEYI